MGFGCQERIDALVAEKDKNLEASPGGACMEKSKPEPGKVGW